MDGGWRTHCECNQYVVVNISVCRKSIAKILSDTSNIQIFKSVFQTTHSHTTNWNNRQFVNVWNTWMPICKSDHKHPKSNLKFAIILLEHTKRQSLFLLHQAHLPCYIVAFTIAAYCYYGSSAIAVAAFLWFSWIVSVLALCRCFNLIQSFTHLHHAIFIIGMHGNYIFQIMCARRVCVYETYAKLCVRFGIFLYES